MLIMNTDQINATTKLYEVEQDYQLRILDQSALMQIMRELIKLGLPFTLLLQIHEILIKDQSYLWLLPIMLILAEELAHTSSQVVSPQSIARTLNRTKAMFSFTTSQPIRLEAVEMPADDKRQLRFGLYFIYIVSFMFLMIFMKLEDEQGVEIPADDIVSVLEVFTETDRVESSVVTMPEFFRDSILIPDGSVPHVHSDDNSSLGLVIDSIRPDEEAWGDNKEVPTTAEILGILSNPIIAFRVDTSIPDPMGGYFLMSSFQARANLLALPQSSSFTVEGDVAGSKIGFRDYLANRYGSPFLSGISPFVWLSASISPELLTGDNVFIRIPESYFSANDDQTYGLYTIRVLQNGVELAVNAELIIFEDGSIGLLNLEGVDTSAGEIEIRLAYGVEINSGIEIGVNGFGNDGQGIDFSAHTATFDDYLGRIGGIPFNSDGSVNTTTFAAMAAANQEYGLVQSFDPELVELTLIEYFGATATEIANCFDANRQLALVLAYLLDQGYQLDIDSFVLTQVYLYYGDEHNLTNLHLHAVVLGMKDGETTVLDATPAMGDDPDQFALALSSSLSQEQGSPVVTSRGIGNNEYLVEQAQDNTQVQLEISQGELFLLISVLGLLGLFLGAIYRAKDVPDFIYYLILSGKLKSYMELDSFDREDLARKFLSNKEYYIGKQKGSWRKVNKLLAKVILTPSERIYLVADVYHRLNQT